VDTAAVRAVSLLAPAAFAALSVAGCYAGTAHAISPGEVAAEVAADPGWLVVKNVPLIRQRSDSDCGSAAAAMVLSYWSAPTTVDELDARDPFAAKHGWRAGELRSLLRDKGFDAFVISGRLDDLAHELRQGRPVVVGVVKRYSGDRALAHYEVVIGVHPARRRILTLDPADGWRENTLEGFDSEWRPSERTTLVVLPRRQHDTAAIQRSPGAS
jgi:ABC-type bacteriocin/lantibiotic exporter with double-glycine peptidase domain